jgi:aldehyde:ferredoxin oxidoreductase
MTGPRRSRGQPPLGCHGRLLRVDLGTGAAASQLLDPDRQRTDAGGGLLGVRLLLDETPPGLDPFDPRLPFCLLSSVVAGVRAVALPRFSVVTKSPLSGGPAESRVEGPFGVALKESGYDGIVLTGAAPRLSYLLVENGHATLHRAAELAGRGVVDTTAALRARHGPEAHVAAVGPAGERRVRFTDLDFAAYRGGGGAVLGAKRVKAVVLAGGRPPALADASAVAALTARYRDAIPANTLTRVQHDPPGFGGVTPLAGYYTAENFRTSGLDGYGGLSGDALAARLVRSSGGCPGCPNDCIKTFDGGAGRAGLHQEALWALGPNLGVADLDALLALNARCHDWGLDPVSLGGVLAWWCELPRHGLRAGGPSFGDVAGLAALAADVAYRRGDGDLLAEGVARAAAAYGRGSGRYAMHVKGVELTFPDPRGSQGQALAYAVSPLGPRYDVVEHDIDFDPEWGSPSSVARAGAAPGGLPMASLDAAKVDLVHGLLELWSGFDALDVCVFAAPPTRLLTEADIAGLVGAVTGWHVRPAEVRAWGRRRWSLLRAYALREGHTPADDTLPERFFTEPITAGRLAGAVLDRDTFDAARRQYYRLAGWI